MSLKKCKILSPLILFVPGKESAHEFKQPWLNTTFARCFALRVTGSTQRRYYPHPHLTRGNNNRYLSPFSPSRAACTAVALKPLREEDMFCFPFVSPVSIPRDHPLLSPPKSEKKSSLHERCQNVF